MEKNTQTPKKRGRKQKNAPQNNVPSNSIIKMLKSSKKEKNIIEQLNMLNDKIDIQTSKTIDFNIDNIIDNSKTTQKTSNIWLDKYKPTVLNEVIGNKEHISKIKEWLNTFGTDNNHSLILSGNHGIGKNIIASLALQEYGYTIKNIQITELKNKAIIDDIINSSIKSKNLINHFDSSNRSIKYGVIINDTESITLKSEKENLLTLFKYNAIHKEFPIICICNMQHSKLINNLKKISLDITLGVPTIDQMKDFIKKIIISEKMSVTDDKVYLYIIKYCQFDIRRLLYILQDLYYIYSNRAINIEMFKEYQLMSQKKDVDVGLYYATKTLIDNYKGINECLQLYYTIKVLLPLTIYENYHKKIFKQNLPNNKILDIITDVTNSISIGDVVETNIYSDQNWFLHTIHGFYTCADTSYIINNIDKNDKKIVQNVNYECVFSADLNKTSSKNINRKKNILTMQNKFKSKSIDDVLYINKIFYELESSKRTKELKKLKDIYSLDNKGVLIALKIDKTNEKTNKKFVKKTSKKISSKILDSDDEDGEHENGDENENRDDYSNQYYVDV
jgi:hypothetical protein